MAGGKKKAGKVKKLPGKPMSEKDAKSVKGGVGYKTTLTKKGY